jgi:hypothetical protein
VHMHAARAQSRRGASSSSSYVCTLYETGPLEAWNGLPCLREPRAARIGWYGMDGSCHRQTSRVRGARPNLATGLTGQAHTHVWNPASALPVLPASSHLLLPADGGVGGRVSGQRKGEYIGRYIRYLHGGPAHSCILRLASLIPLAWLSLSASPQTLLSLAAA